MKLCTVEGCSREHKARGYCPTHYIRFRKHGDPSVTLYPSRHLNSAATCVVADCHRDSYGMGLCRLHYKRVLRFGTVELPIRDAATCSECDKPAHARGLCHMHVQRLYTRGTTEPRYQPTDEERFLAKVPKAGLDDCWEWQGSRHPKGHGYAAVGGKVVYAHRYALELTMGRPLRQDAFACHHCDNPPCVNPTHLYEGDALTNVRDMISRGRAHWQKRRAPALGLANGEGQ